MTERPIARREELVTQEVDDELLIYDLRTSKAYHLTETAALVWKNCDSKHTMEDIKQKLEARFKHKINTEFVILALEQLSKNDLLEEKPQLVRQAFSRRKILKQVGVASMIALPIVASIVVPNTTLAAGSGCSCTRPSDCNNNPPGCTGSCVNGRCSNAPPLI